jgi:uncharacterized GH25 family protein
MNRPHFDRPIEHLEHPTQTQHTGATIKTIHNIMLKTANKNLSAQQSVLFLSIYAFLNTGHIMKMSTKNFQNQQQINPGARKFPIQSGSQHPNEI